MTLGATIRGGGVRMSVPMRDCGFNRVKLAMERKVAISTSTRNFLNCTSPWRRDPWNRKVRSGQGDQRTG